MPTSFSQQEIADILRHEERQSARPQPVTLGSVGVQVAQSLVAGLGAALLLGGGAALLGAPSDIAMQVGLTSAVLATGTGLVLRIVPDNKLATVNRMRRVQRTVLEAEFRKREAYRAIEQLEAQFEGERQQWRDALAELRNENKTLRAENNRYKEDKRPQNFVTSDDVSAAGDAAKIMEHWFTTLYTDGKGQVRGKWWSRNKAEAAGWAQTRHAAAVDLLQRAKVVGMNEKIPFVLPELATYDAALYRLNKYCDVSTQQPDVPQRQAVMSNEDDD